MYSEEIKQKIIISTIECIETYGRANVTIRKIAKQANVNSAAISYYFGGQETLFNIAMKQTLDNAFDISHFSNYENMDIKSYLKNVFTFLINGASKWPNISKAHFYDIYIYNNYNSLATIAINTFLQEIYLKVKDKTSIPEEIIKNRISILMSQVIYFVITPKLLENFSSTLNSYNFMNDLIDIIFFERK